MYDHLDDELKHMDEIESSDDNSLGDAIRLADPIESLPLQKFLVISENSPLSEVIKMLQGNHLSCVVLEKEGRITGIFTERDVLYKVVGLRLDLEKEQVKDFMTPNPHTLKLEDPVAYALNMMVDGGFRTIPVTNDNKQVVSVVGMQDLIQHIGEFFFDKIINLPPKPLRKQTQREGG